MQLAYHQHYVIKTKETTTYYFHLNDNREICYDIYNSENHFIKKEKLVSEIIIDFSVAIGPNDSIHLICITNVGSLLYYINSDNEWKHQLLSKLDVKSNIYRYLLLKTNDKYTHIFCMKTNLLSPMVSSIEHIYWDKKTMHKTTVTSYLPGKYPSPFQVEIDRLNNIHIVYKVYYKKNHQLYYSKFNFINKKWVAGEIISNIYEDHCHPYILLDKKDNLHLVWCSIEDNNFALKYKRRVNILRQKSKWSQPQTLSDRNANYLSPLIIQEGSFLKIMSRQNNHICEILSENYGEKWLASNKNNVLKTEKPLLIRYLTSVHDEKLQYSIQYVYGEITDQIHLLGTKLYTLKDSHQTNLLKIEVEEDSPIASPIDLDENKDGNLDPPIKPSIDENPTPSNKDELDGSYDRQLVEIDKYIDQLELDLQKLQEIKQLLENPLSNPLNILDDYDNDTQFYNKLKALEKEIHTIDKEKGILKDHLILLVDQLNTLENKLQHSRDELLLLQKEVSDITLKNTSFFNKILAFFK